MTWILYQYGHHSVGAEEIGRVEAPDAMTALEKAKAQYSTCCSGGIELRRSTDPIDPTLTKAYREANPPQVSPWRSTGFSYGKGRPSKKAQDARRNMEARQGSYEATLDEGGRALSLNDVLS